MGRTGGFAQGFTQTSLQLYQLQQAKEKADQQIQLQKDQLKLLQARVKGEEAEAELKRQEALRKLTGQVALGQAIAAQGPLGQMSFETPPVLGRTGEGRLAYPDPQGGFFTEKSVTLTDSRLNQGQPTNIPTVFGGQQVSPEEALERLLQTGGRDPETGRLLPGFASIAEAERAAQARSRQLGQTVPGAGVPFRETPFRPELATQQRRFDLLGTALAGGAQLPDKVLTQLLGSQAAEPFTLKPGEVRFSGSGQEVARLPETARTVPPDRVAFEALLKQGVPPLEALRQINERQKGATEASMALDAAGGDPVKALGFLRQQRAASRAQTHINIGERRELAKEQERRMVDRVTQDVTRVLSLLGSAQLPTTGAAGKFLARIPGTAAADISYLLDGIKANIGFQQLNQMRQASPTGGALGNVTEKELSLLHSTLGSLEQAQSQAQFVFNLQRIHDQLLDVVHGPGNGPARLGGSAPPRPETAAPKPDPLGIR